MTRAVVITGLGAVSPLGIGAPTLIERWVAGESGIEDGLGRCREFDPTEHMSRREARRADRFTQLAQVAAGEAIEQAGWGTEPPYDTVEIGCVIGTGVGASRRSRTSTASCSSAGRARCHRSACRR